MGRGQQGGHRRWLMLAVFILTAGAGWFQAAEPTGTFSLAILRRDGILLPFANYDGRRWHNAWPVPAQSVDMPIVLGDTPKSWWPDKRPILDWKLFPLFREVTATAAKITGVNYYRAGCQQGVGLFTDYKPGVLPPPPRVHPYPKDALAFSGDVKIEPIELASTTGELASMLLKMLPEKIAPKETELVDQFKWDRWKHSYSEQERLNVRAQLEALYRVPKGFAPRDLYYFEAVKRYFLPKGKTPEEGAHCDLVTFASGWFSAMGTNAHSITDLGARVIVTSCDYQNVNFMLPLGIVNTGGERPQVVVQWANATFESYMVLEAHPGHSLTQPIEITPLIETPGGACNVTPPGSDEERN
jgi:hypothetical protein